MEGWKRLSFKANDAFIDRARSFCESQIAEKFNDEYICYPMEVYGKEESKDKTYKVLLLGKHFQKDEFKIFSGNSFVKSCKRPQPEFKEETFKSNDGTACTLSDEKKGLLKNSVNAYFKGEKDFQTIKYFEIALDGGNVYVIKVGNQYLGIYETGGELSVDCITK